jgi:ATP-dependent RNA helicase DBP3
LDKAHSGELYNVLKEAGQPVPPELLKFGTAVKKKEHGLYGAHFKAAPADAPTAQPTKMKFDADDDE